MENQYRAHQPVNVKTGQYAGAAGVVEEARDNGMVKVKLAGIIQGEAVDKAVWFKASQLEAA